ncbi:MAG: DNA repair protein RadC [Hydrotalea sp.]|nr:DNA repair protein RadC [Hydrotalea sp.]
MTEQHDGHRQRLRQRFLKDNGAAMADYEILELLLTFALPRIDTKPIAKQLLAEFKTIGGVLSADATQLSRHKFIGESSLAMLKLVQASGLRMLRQDVMAEPHIISGWEKLLHYLHATMAREKREELRLLHLNHRFLLLLDEKIQQGTVNHTPFYVREVVKRVMDVGSSHIIVVHNHPSGNNKPSSADIAETRKLAEALKAMDVGFHDHLIISDHGHYSFKNSGLL